MENKPRLLTGDRPTGRLHLGHYVGSLANRVRLQHQYESFFIIADLHTLTTKPEPQAIKEIPLYIKETVLDYLAVGIDPQQHAFRGDAVTFVEQHLGHGTLDLGRDLHQFLGLERAERRLVQDVLRDLARVVLSGARRRDADGVQVRPVPALVAHLAPGKDRLQRDRARPVLLEDFACRSNGLMTKFVGLPTPAPCWDRHYCHR